MFSTIYSWTLTTGTNHPLYTVYRDMRLFPLYWPTFSCRVECMLSWPARLCPWQPSFISLILTLFFQYDLTLTEECKGEYGIAFSLTATQMMIWDDELQGLVTFIFRTCTSSSLNSSPPTTFLLVVFCLSVKIGRKWKPCSPEIMKLLSERGLIVHIQNSIERPWIVLKYSGFSKRKLG